MKVNHKSLKLGVAFALVSTVGITSAEIIKHELSKPIIAVEETTTTTTESPEKIKYKKEVQEFSKTMRSVVAKYGITNEKLDELVNKWIQLNRRTTEFDEENKKQFIEYIIDSVTRNTLINNMNEAINVVEKANYLDSEKKTKWLTGMKEFIEDQKDSSNYYRKSYERYKYYEEDRVNLINNYEKILDKTINYMKEFINRFNFPGVSIYEANKIIAFSQMLEEREIIQDSQLSEAEKNKMFEKLDEINENIDTRLYVDGNLSFINIDKIISSIRGVHNSEKTSELSEEFSEQIAIKYISKLEREKKEMKIQELISKARKKFPEYSSLQKKEVENENIPSEKLDELLENSFSKGTEHLSYYYGMNFQETIDRIYSATTSYFRREIIAYKAKVKVKEYLESYVITKNEELKKYKIPSEIIKEKINNVVGRLDYREDGDEEFSALVKRVSNQAEKSFNEGIEDYRFKYEAIVKLKDYAKSETQVLLNYGVSNEEILRVVENNFDSYNTRKGYKEQDSVYVDNLFQNLKKQYHVKVLEEVIKIKVSKFREEQEKLILADNRYTDVEKEKVISEIRMRFGEPVIHFLRNKLYNNAKEFDTLSLSQKIEKMLSVVNDNIQNTHFTAPMNKNKYTVNNVALNEKLEINQDSSLSLSEKLALQLKVDELAEKVIKKIETLNLIGVNREGIPRAMTAEELAVFVEQIQNIHNAKEVNNANEAFKPKEEKIEKPLLEKPAPTQPIDNGGTITEKPSVLPELKPVQSTETTSTIELKPVVSTEKEEKTTEVISNKVETTKENEETTKEVVSRNKWEKKGNHWYYVDNDGKVVSKQWVGSYYIKADKTMAENEWIYDAKYNSWFYLDENGHYVENTWKDQYYLKSGGYMAKNEWIFDSSYNSWYYLNEDGSYARNQWIQLNGKWYYVLSNGKMAKNTVIDGYQLNENGEWI
ncbi:hypothetical protein [Granulicatella sp.]